ncbi:MAG: MFS transporter [Calditrichaeota bacterium]|nr:MAG: MFS transporter [Calditrichota bacterium]
MLRIPMLVRFCAYGFLKNQRYFEPFFVLALLEKNLTFFQIGILFSFREFMINIVEIPSGSFADIYGRRRSMLISFFAYILSFFIFGSMDHYSLLFVAMFFYAIGDAFRSGTHKSMIFSYLRINGKQDQRLTYYGTTRSWSKMGSALSAIISGFFVYYFQAYAFIFYFSCIPYMINVLNLLTYPAELNGKMPEKGPVIHVFKHTKNALREIFKTTALRNLIYESMGFDGVFSTMKEYLQPALKALAIGMLMHASLLKNLTDIQKSVILIVPVYTLLFLTSAWISRNAQKIITTLGNENIAALISWGFFLIFSVTLTIAGFAGILWFVALAFVLMYSLQNLWRPFLLSRLDSCSKEQHGATILSIESQSRRVVTVVLAPLLGYGFDALKTGQTDMEYALVGILGIVSSILFLSKGLIKFKNQI